MRSTSTACLSLHAIGQQLIYTHGYGITMNTANGFDSEGMPKFVLSNMPVESTAPEIKITRPEIYFGQETTHDVYVKTKPGIQLSAGRLIT